MTALERQITGGSSIIGVDLGGTKTAAGMVLPDGRVRCQVTAPTPASAGAEAVIAAVLDLLVEVRRRGSATALPPAAAIGIGSAGVIDPRTGTVLASTDHIADWAGTPLAPVIAAGTGLPTRALNDVHAHALGEVRHGAGRGLDVVLLVAAGTGVGGSLVIGGVPVLGSRATAGHFGHVPVTEAAGLTCPCGGRGHLEAVASGPGLLSRYRSHGGRADSGRAVVEAAAAGDRAAAESLTFAGRALGRAVGGWVNMIDPDAVIVTGGLARAGRLWWDALTGGVRQEAVSQVRGCPIVPAQTGPNAAILGAAAYAELSIERSDTTEGFRP